MKRRRCERPAKRRFANHGSYGLGATRMEWLAPLHDSVLLPEPGGGYVADG
jgi:hypothetical protein